jgi:hypothetical protein
MNRYLWGLLAGPALALFLVAGQAAKQQEPVEGFYGRAEVTVNTVPSQSSVMFEQRDASFPGGLKRTVYVLQHVSGTPLPRAWAGSGRLFLAHGVLAVVGEEGTKWMFKFPDRDIPASLKRFNFGEAFSVFGIARYGESKLLTADQIMNLKTVGKCSAAASPLEEDQAKCSKCTSGGPGASACSAGGQGGCSVTCMTGNYACCDANSNQCFCCKIENIE